MNKSNNFKCSGLKSEKIITLILVSLVLTLVTLPCVQAADTNWITLNSVYDLTDNVTLQDSQPLTAGHGYNVTFTVDIPYTQSQSEFQVSLNSEMSQKATQFWYLVSSYSGYDATKFTAGLRTISFNQVQGQLVLTAVFLVPADYTISPAGSLSLHGLKSNIRIVEVKVTGGSIVGTLDRGISDEAIERYLGAYSEKSAYISQGKIDSSYSGLINGILSQAQSVYNMGLPDDALAIINTVNQSNFPAPPNNTMSLVLIVVVIVVAAVAGVAALMFMRTKARLGNVCSVVKEVQLELAAQEISAGQFDQKLAEKLAYLKNKIGEAVE